MHKKKYDWFRIDDDKIPSRIKIIKIWLTDRLAGTSLKLGCLASCTSCNKTPSVVVRNAPLCFSRDSAKRRSVWLKNNRQMCYQNIFDNHLKNWLIGRIRFYKTISSVNKHWNSSSFYRPLEKKLIDAIHHLTWVCVWKDVGVCVVCRCLMFALI